MTRWGILAMSLAMGCAPALSTFTPAAVTPGPVRFRGALAMGASVPVGQVSDLIDTAETLSTRLNANEMLSDADRQRLYNSIAGLVVSPPGASPEMHVRMGLGHRADIGFRTTFSDYRLDGRYQLLESAHAPFDLSVGLGLSMTRVAFPLGDALEPAVSADGFSAYAVEVPVLAGWSGRFGAFWFGPKVLLRSFSSAIQVRTTGDTYEAMSLDGRSVYGGGQIGGMLGFRWVFLAFELSVMGMSSTGSVQVGNGAYRAGLDFGGLVIAPTVGLVLQI